MMRFRQTIVIHCCCAVRRHCYSDDVLFSIGWCSVAMRFAYCRVATVVNLHTASNPFTADARRVDRHTRLLLRRVCLFRCLFWWRVFCCCTYCSTLYSILLRRDQWHWCYSDEWCLFPHFQCSTGSCSIFIDTVPATCMTAIRDSGDVMFRYFAEALLLVVFQTDGDTLSPYFV